MKRRGLLWKALPPGWVSAIREFLALLMRVCRRRRVRHGREGRTARSPCVPIDHPAFVRPDPLIYSQHYLMKQGLAVTWDNPDIHLELNGVVVPSSSLQTSTEYQVVARIWNASFDGPVVLMPVHFSYLDFGAGTKPIPIGTKQVSVGVRGAPDNPASVSTAWTTPPDPGHYCLQVRLTPADDTNFENNLGQENTTVGEATSPAMFSFRLRNDTRARRRYRFAVDTYTIPPREPCDQHDREAARKARLARQAAGTHPLPTGWDVAIDPADPELDPGQEIDVAATITPPDEWRGTQPINVNGFHDEGPAGGVTLMVHRS